LTHGGQFEAEIINRLLNMLNLLILRCF